MNEDIKLKPSKDDNDAVEHENRREDGNTVYIVFVLYLLITENLKKTKKHNFYRSDDLMLYCNIPVLGSGDS